MTIDEQKKIAYDAGRLAAWRGQIHKPSGFEQNPALALEWRCGAEAQCKVMSAEAAKIPLLFADERVSKSPSR